MLPASAQEASEQKWNARSNSKKFDHKPYTFDLYFISHIPGIIHSKTDSTYEYIAGYVKIGEFRNSSLELMDFPGK